MRLRLWVILLILAAIPVAGIADDLTSQKAAVTGFYSTAFTFKEPGIPSKKNTRKLSPYISREFLDLLLKADDAETLYSKKTKGQVPPLMESFVFYSEFEGASSIGAITPEKGKGNPTFLVELSYTGPYGRHEKTSWKDRVMLLRENNKWVVNDIELLGNWAFGDKGRVQDNLRSVIKEAEEAKPE